MMCLEVPSLGFRKKLHLISVNSRSFAVKIPRLITLIEMAVIYS